MSDHASVRVPADKLRRWTATVFRAVGAPPRAAIRAADVLHYADLSGIDTHGVANLDRVYVQKCESGRINPTAVSALVVDLGAAAVFDAGRGLGAVAGRTAMRWAVAAAGRYGVGLAAVRNSSHFGAAGYYARLALGRGMIGLAMTNLGGQGIAPPPGGTIPLLGTNPLAAAAPAGELPPFVLDMSTTAAATGKIRQAARRGEPIPEGWLIDPTGRPLCDPSAFDRGAALLQFVGGHKGYGLAVLVDVLCGLLPGAGVGPTPAALVSPQDDANVGHLFIAIDAPRLRPTGFSASADQMLNTLLRCPTAAGFTTGYAGLLEHRARTERRLKGVPLDAGLFESLNQLADRLALPRLEPADDLFPTNLSETTP